MEEDGNNTMAKEKLDQVATWVGATVTSAFFSSLERFACVNVTTDDDDDDEEDDDDVQVQVQVQDETKDPPKTLNDQSQSQNDVAKLPVWIGLGISPFYPSPSISYPYIVKSLIIEPFLIIC